jgi:hypothetical protein
MAPVAECTCRLPCTQLRSQLHDWRDGFALPCLPGQCTDVTSCKQLARISGNQNNLNTFCRLDSAWCTGLCIVSVHHDLNAYTYDDVCMCFELHDSTVYRFGHTSWSQTVHFDNNYTQKHHPVPFLCPWPVPDCGGHHICCQANFTVLVKMSAMCDWHFPNQMHYSARMISKWQPPYPEFWIDR